jgi:penicillin-binding protein 2
LSPAIAGLRDKKAMDDEQMRDKRFTRRSLMLGAGGAGLFGLLGGKLYNLQSIEGRRYRSLAEDNRMALRFTSSVRGRIFDNGGRLIASNRENLRILIIPAEAGNIGRSLDLLAPIVKISQRQRQKIMARARRQNPRLPIMVADGLSWKQFARINVKGSRIPGVSGEIGWKRHYDHGREVAHAVGHLGQPDEMQLAAEPALRLPGSLVGVSGVERGFDKYLRGRPGRSEIEIDAQGREVKTISTIKARDGEDLYLTIDRQLQKRIFKHLAPYRRAAATAIDIDSGEIVAMCSTPTFDPNIFTHPINEKKWNELRRNPDHPLEDKAARGQYPPGSTFKMVTALAALEAGLINSKTRFKCAGHMEWENHKFHCWNRSGHGWMRLHNALKQSCDVYFYETARIAGMRRIAAMARRLGLGQTYDCGLAGQKAGLIPDPDWKQEVKGRRWFGGETVLAAIGQGYVLSTPLQLAVMTARIASGRKIEPRIAWRADERNSLPPQAPPLDIDEKSLRLIRRAMSAVVNERGGTGKRAALGWPGVKMAGKTGTSQVRGHGRRRRRNSSLEWKFRDHALFVAYAPVKNPRFALAVIIEHGGSGGKKAAPLARNIMQTLLLHDAAKSAAPAPGGPDADNGELMGNGPAQREL